MAVRLRGGVILSLVAAAILLFFYLHNKPLRSGGSSVKTVNETVRVDVYYECLCPDSRNFVVNQLYPAWSDLKDIMEVNLIPYGKAFTEAKGDGYSFSCQHGPPECEGNKYHACAVKLQDTQISVPYVNCMINNNFVPAQIAQTCAEKFSIPFSTIEECAKGKEGEKLLYVMGELTKNLNPSVTFIPTIEIEGSQNRFKNALKNLALQVCLEFKEKFKRIHPHCTKFVH